MKNANVHPVFQRILSAEDKCQPWIPSSHNHPDGDLTIGDIRVDLYGKYYDGGDEWELETIALHGTKIDLTSIISDEQKKDLEDRFNAMLPHHSERERTRREDALHEQREVRRDLGL